MIKNIVLMVMVVFLVGCENKKPNDTTSDLTDNSELVFSSKAIQYVRDGEREVMLLNVKGCVDKGRDDLKFSLSRGDWKSFDIDQNEGEISFNHSPDSRIKKEYKFTAIATACIDKKAELNITVQVIGELEDLPTHKGFTVAKSNGLENLSINFHDLTVTVFTDTEVNEVSPDTVAIYGNVRGEGTNALLKLNSNYPTGTKFLVKVYEGTELIKISDELILGGEFIEFADIN